MLLLTFAASLLLAAHPQASGSTQDDCSTPQRRPTAASTLFCDAQEQERRGRAVTAPAARAALLEMAARAYRRAADAATTASDRSRALDALTRVYAADALDDAGELELVLRELVDVNPGDLSFMFRLAAHQEAQGAADAAEDTLLTARRQAPAEIEPYRRLAQFYARRAAALQPGTVRERMAEPANAGTPDADGVFPVGGGIAPPERTDIPRMPPEARALGIKGAVIVEVVIDETGAVRDAKVARSIPLLDDAALQAVRGWQFTPTVVNGRPVPVRMNLAVNFQP